MYRRTADDRLAALRPRTQTNHAGREVARGSEGGLPTDPPSATGRRPHCRVLDSLRVGGLRPGGSLTLLREHGVDDGPWVALEARAAAHDDWLSHTPVLVGQGVLAIAQTQCVGPFVRTETRETVDIEVPFVGMTSA